MDPVGRLCSAKAPDLDYAPLRRSATAPCLRRSDSHEDDSLLPKRSQGFHGRMSMSGHAPVAWMLLYRRLVIGHMYR